MSTLECWIAYAGTAVIVGALLFFGGYIKGCTQATRKAAVVQAKAKAKAQSKADALSADNAKLSQAVTQAQDALSQLNAAVAALPPTVKYVYVHPKRTPQAPTPAPVAITGPVYVSVGAVILYDSALGTAGLYGSGGFDAATSALPSSVTVSQYEDTSVSNAGACLVNTTMLLGLQAKVRDWIKAGAVKEVP